MQTNKVEDLKPLTSLRFIAAMAIVLLHAPTFFSWPWLKQVPAVSVQGVSFFFVLSGFILTHVYNSKPFPGYFEFVSLRIARLWPLHFCATLLLFVTIPGGEMTYSGPGLLDRNVALPVNLSLFHAMVPTTSYVFSWNAVSWSISTEYLFYLAFPLLLINIRSNWALKVAVFTVIGAALFPLLSTAGLPATTEDPFSAAIYPVLYANPLSRGVQFCVGMAAWVLWDRYLRHQQMTFVSASLIEIATLSALLLWLSNFDVISAASPSQFSMWFKITGCTLPFAAFIVVFASGRGIVGAILSRPSLVWLGQISFAIYLLHYVLMKIFVLRLPVLMSSELMFFATLFLLTASAHYAIEMRGKLLILSFLLTLRRIAKFHPRTFKVTQPPRIPRSASVARSETQRQSQERLSIPSSN